MSSAAPAAAAAAAASAAAPGSTRASTDAPLFIEHTNKTLGCTPTDVKWCAASPRFVTTGTHPKGTGSVQVWEMVPSEGARAIGEVVRPEGVKCGTFGASFLEDRHFAAGDCKGSLAILDLSRSRGSGAAAPAASSALTAHSAAGGGDASGGGASGGVVVWHAPRAHVSMVNCIDGCGGLGIGGGAPELVTGGRDGCVKLWDPRLAEPVLTVEPASGEGGRECWCVAFGGASADDERCIAAGYDNGDVKLFDLRTQGIRWETNIGNGGACGGNGAGAGCALRPLSNPPLSISLSKHTPTHSHARPSSPPPRSRVLRV